MFKECIKFDKDISGWDVSKVKFFNDVFYKSNIKEKHKPLFKINYEKLKTIHTRKAYN